MTIREWEAVATVRDEINGAIAQMIETDDTIICNHIRKAEGMLHAILTMGKDEESQPVQILKRVMRKDGSVDNDKLTMEDLHRLARWISDEITARAITEAGKQARSRPLPDLPIRSVKRDEAWRSHLKNLESLENATFPNLPIEET